MAYGPTLPALLGPAVITLSRVPSSDTVTDTLKVFLSVQL